MSDYIFIFLADLMLAIDFSLNKVWQRCCGASLKTGFVFNLLTGLFKVLIFYIINDFSFEITGFSVIMALLMGGCCFCYIMIGQRILKEGQIVLYTLFLMLGGMCVPYTFGILMLGEEMKLLSIIGLGMIVTTLILMNYTGHISRKQFFMSLCVFLLNGFCSVISKIHQISKFDTVSSAGFVMLTGISTVVFAGVGLVFFNEKKTEIIKKQKLKGLSVAVMSSLAGGFSYLLQLGGAKCIPASALYPIISGGSIALSIFTGWVILKEKPNKKILYSAIICLLGTLLFIF